MTIHRKWSELIDLDAVVDLPVLGEESVDMVVETFAVAVIELPVLGVGSTAMAIELVVKSEEEGSAAVAELERVCDTL